MAKVFADDVSLCTADQPLISYRRFAIIDSAGNNNRKLDRNEAGDCILTVRCNAGSVSNLVGTLHSLTPDLQVLQANGDFGNLSLGDSAANGTSRFVLQASASAPIETPLWCDLYLTGTGFAETLKVPIVVGDSMNEPLGPNAYGYRAFDDGDITYSEHPTYNWVEIHGIGNKVTLGDDATQTIDLPPEFGPIYYYGQRTTKLSICSNGWVAPDTSTRLDFNNIRLPDSYAPQRIIALNWDNLDPTPYGWIGYYHDAANHRFIVEYDSVPYFPQYVTWEKFQIIFYDTTLAGPSGDNVFVVQYATANNVGSVGVGIQNNEGTSGLTYLQNLGYPRQSAPIVPGRAIKYIAMSPTAISEHVTRPSSLAPRRPSLVIAPNPFSNATTITYTLPGPAACRLGLYDATGRLLRELVNARVPAGIHRYEFTIHHSQFTISPGVYFCRLLTEQGDATQKLLIR